MAAWCASSASPPDQEQAIAGQGVQGYYGDGGPATRAALSAVQSLAADGAGNVVVADNGNCRVRVIAVRSGRFYGRRMTRGDIYTVAGDGTCGNHGDGGPATSAQLNPGAVAVDTRGDLIIADEGVSEIRVVAARSGRFYGRRMTAGDIYRVAGGGPYRAGLGDGGPAYQATLSSPSSVAVDPEGNLVIDDNGYIRVRVVAARSGRFYGRHMTAGDIYNVAGDGNPGWAGEIYGRAAIGTGMSPWSTTVGPDGNLIITEWLPYRIEQDCEVLVVAARSGTFFGQAMTAGRAYRVMGTASCGWNGTNHPPRATELNFGNQKTGAAVDRAGNLVVADSGGGRVLVLAERSGIFYGQAMTAGHVYTIAGGGSTVCRGGEALNAQLYLNDGIPYTSFAGGLAVTTAGNYLVSSGDQVCLVATRSGTYFGQAMRAGHIYPVAGNGRGGYSGDGGPATAAELSYPGRMALDAHGNLIIPDVNNNRIRVVAARAGTYYNQPMTAGDIYTIAGTGTFGRSGDGGPATAAELSWPGVGVDSAGNVLVADTASYQIQVIAAHTGTYYGQAMTAGDIYTIAGNGIPGYSGNGGPATDAQLSNPEGVVVDSAGNLLIPDSNNNVIRVVAAHAGTYYGQAMTAGDIYTIAGNGTSGFLGDGGPATAAELYSPLIVAVAGSGRLVIADSGNNRLRLVSY